MGGAPTPGSLPGGMIDIGLPLLLMQQKAVYNASLAVYIRQAEEAADRRCGPKTGRIADVYTNVYDPGLQMYTTDEGGQL